MRHHVLLGTLIVFLGLAIGAQDTVELRSDVKIYALAPGIWRHVTYMAMEGWGMVPENGLIVKDEDKAILVDTPWTTSSPGSRTGKATIQGQAPRWPPAWLHRMG